MQQAQERCSEACTVTDHLPAQGILQSGAVLLQVGGHPLNHMFGGLPVLVTQYQQQRAICARCCPDRLDGPQRALLHCLHAPEVGTMRELQPARPCMQHLRHSEVKSCEAGALQASGRSRQASWPPQVDLRCKCC